MLKFYLHRAQNRMRQTANKERSYRNFEVRDWVFLKLHPYSQHSLKKHGNQKFLSKYFVPFKVLEKVRIVAYKLDLLDTTWIHLTVHVLQLKLDNGDIQQFTALPIEFTHSEHRLPQSVLGRKMVRRGNKADTKFLV